MLQSVMKRGNHMYRCEHYIPDRGFQLEIYHNHGQTPHLVCKLCYAVFTQEQALEAIEGVMARVNK